MEDPLSRQTSTNTTLWCFNRVKLANGPSTTSNLRKSDDDQTQRFPNTSSTNHITSPQDLISRRCRLTCSLVHSNLISKYLDFRGMSMFRNSFKLLSLSENKIPGPRNLFLCGFSQKYAELVQETFRLQPSLAPLLARHTARLPCCSNSPTADTVTNS